MSTSNINNINNFLYGAIPNSISGEDKNQHWLITFIRDSKYFKERSAAIYDMMIKDSLLALGDITLFRELLNKNDTHNAGAILTKNLQQEISAIIGIIGKQERSTELIIDENAYSDGSSSSDQIKDQIKKIQSLLNRELSQLDFKLFDIAIDRLEQRLIFGVSYAYFYLSQDDKIKYRLLDPLQVYESADNNEEYLYIFEDFETVASIQMNYGIDKNTIDRIRQKYNSYNYEYYTFYNNSYKEFLIRSFNEQYIAQGAEKTASIMMFSPDSGQYSRKKIILDSVDNLHVIHAFISVLVTGENIVKGKCIKTANTVCRHLVFMGDELVFSQDQPTARPPIVRLGKKIVPNSCIYGYRGLAYNCIQHLISYSAILSRAIDGAVNSPSKKIFLKSGILKDKKTNVSSTLKNTIVPISNTDQPINTAIQPIDMGLVDQGAISMLAYLQNAIRTNCGLLDMSQMTSSAQQEQLRLNVQENSLYRFTDEMTDFMKQATKVISDLLLEKMEDVPDINGSTSVRVMLTRYSEGFNRQQLNKIMNLTSITGSEIQLPMSSIFDLLDIDKEIQEKILGTMGSQSENREMQKRKAASEIENTEADTFQKTATGVQKMADAVVTIKNKN